MVLRDLSDRAVGFRQDGGDLRQHRVGDVNAVIVGGHGDREQARLGQRIELVEGQDAVGIPFVRAFGEFACEITRDLQRLLLAFDPMCREPCLLGKLRDRPHVIAPCR